jgi:hypothetical protein
LIASEKANVAQRHAARRAAEEQAALEFADAASLLQEQLDQQDSLLQTGTFRTISEQKFVEAAGLAGAGKGGDGADSDSTRARSRAAAEAAAAEAQAAAMAAAEAQAAKEAAAEISKSHDAERRTKEAEQKAAEAAAAKADTLSKETDAAAHAAAAVTDSAIVETGQARMAAAEASAVASDEDFAAQTKMEAAAKLAKKQTGRGRAAETLAFKAAERASIVAEQGAEAERAAARAAAVEAANIEAGQSLISLGSFRTTKEQAYVDRAGITGDADLDADDSIHRSEAASKLAAAEAQAAALSAAEAQHYKDAFTETSKSLESEDKLKAQEAAYYDQATKKADALAVAAGASAHQAAAVDPSQAEKAATSVVAAGVNAKEQTRINLQRFQAFKAANRIVRAQSARGRAAEDIAKDGSAKALIASEKANVAQRHAARRAAEEQAALEFGNDAMFLQTSQAAGVTEYNKQWQKVYQESYKQYKGEEDARKPEIARATLEEEQHLNSIYGKQNLNAPDATAKYNQQWRAVMAAEEAKIPGEISAEDAEVSHRAINEEKFLTKEYHSKVGTHVAQPAATHLVVKPVLSAPKPKHLRVQQPSAQTVDPWFEAEDDNAFVRREHKIAQQAHQDEYRYQHGHF